MTTGGALGICFGIFILWPAIWVFIAWNVWKRNIHFRKPWVSGGEIPQRTGGSGFRFNRGKKGPYVEQ